jgi:hypothetical protein
LEYYFVTTTSRTALELSPLSIHLELKALFPLIKAVELEFSHSYLVPNLGNHGDLLPYTISLFVLVPRKNVIFILIW